MPVVPLRALSALAAALVVVLLPPPVSPSAQAATTGEVRWSVTPVDDAAGPRVSLRHEVDPGSGVQDAVLVSNTGTVDTEFVVAAGTGVVGPDGAFDVVEGGPAGSGAWVALEGLDDGRLLVPAGGQATVPVRVDVPVDATPGDHPAGVVVGVVSGDGGDTVTHRLGVRLHLRVTGDLAPSLAVGDVRTTASPSWIPFGPSPVRVEWTTTNTGNVRLGAGAVATAAGPFGLGASSARAEGPVELLPGASTTQSVEVSPLALVTLAGQVRVAPSVVGDDTVALPGTVEVGWRETAVPWTGLALLAVLVGLVVVLVRRRGRRGPGAADGAR